METGMNALVKFPQRAPGFLSHDRDADAGEAKLSQMTFGQGGTGSAMYPSFGLLPAGQLLPERKLDYAREVGDGLNSSVLMAPLNWLMRTFPEAPPIVEKRSRQGQWSEVFPHALTTLLETPNPCYSGLELTMATVLDLAFGNAYWIKIRNGLGEVVQLWWVPRYMIVPRWSSDGTTYITHYDYLSFGKTQQIPPDDVVHFRFGIDPRNIRLGLSPLSSLLREIVMDDQAADFATAILKNLGVIGVVVSPKAGASGPAAEKALQEVKVKLKENFTAERRGEPMAIGAPTDVQLLQYNMQGFDVSPLRDVSEERVCAALGIPAAVVGFGTGLQQTKVGATMKEMRQLAWTGGLMPLQKIVARTIDRTLLSDRIYDGVRSYEPPPATTRSAVRMRFDNNQVRALWEDSSSKHDRVRKDWLSGMIMRSEARQETGRTFTAADAIYIQPVNVTQLDANGEPKPMPSNNSDPAATDTPASDGGGSASQSDPSLPSTEDT
jgi:phage portal protein BeeE